MTPASPPSPDDGGLLSLIDVGGAIAGAVIAVGVALYALLSAPAEWDIAQIATSPTLLGLALFLGIFWLRVGSHEGRMLDQVGAGVLPPIPWYATALIALSGLLFGGLFIAALYPPLFCLVLLLIKGIESWNAYVAGRRIDAAIEKAYSSRELPAAQSIRGVSLARWHDEAQVLDRYFFGHPWYQVAVSFCIWIAVVAAIGSNLVASNDSSVRDLGLLIAAFGAILGIFGNEAVVAYWRHVRKAEFRLALSPPEDHVAHKVHQHYPLGAELLAEQAPRAPAQQPTDTAGRKRSPRGN